MSPKRQISSEEKAKLVLEALEDRKGVDPVVVDVRGRTLVSDFFVVVTGTSNIHIRALADAVIDRLADNGIKGKRIEGYEAADWILLDYGDVVVHIMAQDQRDFYRLEAYWSGEEKGSPALIAEEEE